MELREANRYVVLKEESTCSEEDTPLAELSQVSYVGTSELVAEEVVDSISEDEYSDTTFYPYEKEKKRKSKSKRTKDVNLKCEKCDYSTKVGADLIKHQLKHSDTKPFCCPIDGCNHSSRYPHNIKHHMRIHSQHRPHNCDECGRAFKTKSALQTHKLRHSNDKPFLCTMCPFSCKRNTELKSHHIHAHTTEKKFECNVCNLKTKFKADLKKHLKTHLREYERENVTCDICGKICRGELTLKRHVQYVHLTEDQPCECSICGKHFKREEHMKRHQKYVHLDGKVIECDVCGKKFANKLNKANHMVTHDDERQNFCPLCPYKAKTESHLRSHIGQMHTDQFLVNYCKCCNRKFVMKNKLVQHVEKELHVRNSENSEWKGQELFEYRLEPRSSFTKKSQHITCYLTQVPNFRVEKRTPRGGAFPVVKQELVDIKTEPHGSEEYETISNQMNPSMNRNVDLQDNSAECQDTQGPKNQAMDRDYDAVTESTLDTTRQRETTEPSENSWTVISYSSNVCIKMENDDSDYMDSHVINKQMYSHATKDHMDMERNIENSETDTQKTEESGHNSANILTVLATKKNGRSKGCKNKSNIKENSRKPLGKKEEPSKKNSFRIMLNKSGKSKGIKMKVKLPIAIKNKSKNLEQKQRDGSVTARSKTAKRGKRGRLMGSKAMSNHNVLHTKNNSAVRKSRFEIEYDYTEEPNVYADKEREDFPQLSLPCQDETSLQAPLPNGRRFEENVQHTDRVTGTVINDIDIQNEVNDGPPEHCHQTGSSKRQHPCMAAVNADEQIIDERTQLVQQERSDEYGSQETRRMYDLHETNNRFDACPMLTESNACVVNDCESAKKGANRNKATLHTCADVQPVEEESTDSYSKIMNRERNLGSHQDFTHHQDGFVGMKAAKQSFTSLRELAQFYK